MDTRQQLISLYHNYLYNLNKKIVELEKLLDKKEAYLRVKFNNEIINLHKIKKSFEIKLQELENSTVENSELIKNKVETINKSFKKYYNSFVTHIK